MPTRLYLDHAATTPLIPAAREAVLRGLDGWANASSPHAEGRSARAALESARRVIADAHGWGGELIFTSGATEALAIALARTQARAVAVGATEHDAVLRAVPGATRLSVGEDGRLVLAELAAVLVALPAPALVAVQWGNSETGVLQPIGEIARIVHAAGGMLLVDAAQMPVGWPGADRPQDHADLVALSAHKRGGPPGIGALLVRDFGMLLPTGGQERGYRGGTENVPAALGFAAAAAASEPIEAWARMRASLDDAVRSHGGIVVAEASPRAPHVGSYRLPGMSAAAQLIRFDLSGIAVSAGSACSSGSMRPSHVLGAMRWEGAPAGEVIRVSFGRDTAPEDVARFAESWGRIAEEARARVPSGEGPA